MQNLGNVYICGAPFVMSRIRVQNGQSQHLQVLDSCPEFLGAVETWKCPKGNCGHFCFEYARASLSTVLSWAGITGVF
jgi:hypothetical protein